MFWQKNEIIKFDFSSMGPVGKIRQALRDDPRCPKRFQRADSRRLQAEIAGNVSEKRGRKESRAANHWSAQSDRPRNQSI